MELFTSIAIALLTFGLLVTFHEFGHFWVARRCGVKVLRFSVGFGKTLFSFHDKRGTEYVIGLLPLGGYVKMVDEREGPVADADLDMAFNRQPLACADRDRGGGTDCQLPYGHRVPTGLSTSPV